MEGDADQRRRAASRARAEGKRPSEVGATLGASKQRKHADGHASHQERLDTRREGKVGGSGVTGGKPRPGNRDTDPKRSERWR